MLRSGAAKISLGTFNSGGGSTRVPAGPADGGRRDGASLSQLESVLQRLNKHDERVQIHSVERTSVQTQHKLLKDELLKAQEELAVALSGKHKLCEQIGALQQAKQDQQTQIEHLLTELRSSRESQAVMAKKVAQLETGCEDLKRNYTRSLTYRVKSANELLSRLNLTGAFADIGDASNAIREKCEVWVGSEPNKRKRVHEGPRSGVVDGDVVEDDPMIGEPVSTPHESLASIGSSGSANDIENIHKPAIPSTDFGSSETATIPEEMPDRSHEIEENEACQSCIDLTLQNSTMKAAAEEEILATKNELIQIQAQNSQLVKSHEEGQEKGSALLRMLEEKEGMIEGLKEALEIEKEKVIQAERSLQQSVETKEDHATDDSAARIKVLEDNLAQLNTYADHLEMLISQCASCSVKLQSENTQESMK